VRVMLHLGEQRLEDPGLGPEGGVDGLDSHPGSLSDRSDGGRLITALGEQLQAGGGDTPAGVLRPLFAQRGAVTPPGTFGPPAGYLLARRPTNFSPIGCSGH
jgi:hypothetical protein